MPDLKNALKIESEWDEFRNLRMAFLVLLITCVPGSFSVLYISGKYLGTVAPGFVVFAVWSLTAAVYGFRFAFWPCPRCSAAFAVPWGVFTRRCRSCGLRMGQSPDNGDAEGSVSSLS